MSRPKEFERTLSRWWHQTVAALFITGDDSAGRLQRVVQYAWIGGLYLLGLGILGFFLNWGDIPFETHDWSQEWRFFTILQESVRGLQLPLHTNLPAYATLRFLAIPQTTHSPQIVLLSWLNLGPFILVNTWILYTAGFLGCLLIKRRFKLSGMAFGLLVMLFTLNGHVIAQVAVGHSMWIGFYLLPFFFLLVFIFQEYPGPRWPYWMALVLFLIFVQGSVHILVWSLFFLGLLWIVSSGKRIPLFKAVVLAAFLSAYRITPGIIDFGRPSSDSWPGYFSATHMLSGLIDLVLPETKVLGGFSRWEYDSYIGLLGFVFLILFGVILVLYPGGNRENLRGRFGLLYFPAGVLTIFSFGSVYQIFRLLPIPLLSHERVPSRFLVMAVLTLTVLASMRLQAWFRRRGPSPGIQFAVLGIFFVIIHDLVQHARVWRVENIRKLFEPSLLDPTLAIAALEDTTGYLPLLSLGAMVTIVALVFTLYRLWVLRTKSESATSG